MNIKNLLLPNPSQDHLQVCLSNYCMHKTPVLITVFDKPSEPCGILYKVLKQNNLLNCIIVPCKNKYSELKRFEKVIKRNFDDACIIIIRDCDCTSESFGNVCLSTSSLHFVSDNCIFDSIGDVCLTICDNLIVKAPFVVGSLQKLQTLNIISGVYNIICSAFNGK